MVKINTLKGYEAVSYRYFVTKEGKILSIDEKGTKELKIKLSNPSMKSKNGYRTVCLMTNELTENKRGNHICKRKIYPKVSRIVATAFVYNNNPLVKKQVDYIDRNKLNDNYINLRWVSGKENSRFANAKKLYRYGEEGLEKIYECGKDVEKDNYNFGHAMAVARGVENHHKQKVFTFNKITQEEVIQRLSKSVRVY